MFIASRLTPLDKNLELTLKSVGDVFRRIIEKTVIISLKDKIISFVGLLEVCNTCFNVVKIRLEMFNKLRLQSLIEI